MDDIVLNIYIYIRNMLAGGKSCKDIIEILENEVREHDVDNEKTSLLFGQIHPRFQEVCLAILTLINDGVDTKSEELASLFKQSNVDAMFALLSPVVGLIDIPNDNKPDNEADHSNSVAASSAECDRADQNNNAEVVVDEEVIVSEVHTPSRARARAATTSSGRHGTSVSLRLTSNAER